MQTAAISLVRRITAWGTQAQQETRRLRGPSFLAAFCNSMCMPFIRQSWYFVFDVDQTTNHQPLGLCGMRLTLVMTRSAGGGIASDWVLCKSVERR